MDVCFECDGEDQVEDHHVVPVSLGGTRTVRLCYVCHQKAHGFRGLGRSSSGWVPMMQKDADSIAADLLRQGLTTHEVAKQMNAAGVPSNSPSGKWRSSSYSGVMRRHGIEYPKRPPGRPRKS